MGGNWFQGNRLKQKWEESLFSLSLSPEMIQNQVETLAEDNRTPVEEELKEIDTRYMRVRQVKQLTLKFVTQEFFMYVV